MAASTASRVDPRVARVAAISYPTVRRCGGIAPRPRGDRLQALGYGVNRALCPAAAKSVTVSQIGC